MKMSELILAIGDDNVGFQNLDQSVTALTWAGKSGTKITFGTEETITPNGTRRLGLVLWLDRDAVKAAVASARSPDDLAKGNATPEPATEALVGAARRVFDGLNARIDAAVAKGDPVPVFDGIADLHEALAALPKGGA